MNATEETSHNRRYTQLSLAAHLRERIRETGPITFRDWMEAALYDPYEGYYRRANLRRWGRQGDYRTSPERSPLFAVTFARYFAGLYEALNRPGRWTIVEMGAGGGHFAEGVLTTLQLRFPDILLSTRYVIDEVSESSGVAARARLARFGPNVEFLPLTETAIEAGLIFSNELLDSFAVHRVTVHDGQLNEFYVTLDKGGEFKWTLGPPSTLRISEYLDFVGALISEGQVVEINLGIEDWLTKIAARLGNGYIVTVDYGHDASELHGITGREQGTLRAIRRHQFVDDVLAQPGEQDLTTTIDWSFVRKLGERLGLETVEFERQDRFLLKAGLIEELQAAAAQSETEAEKLKLRLSSREMIFPDGMAASFQVLVQKKALRI
ncbi:MAG TPA: SAM-dependent methyltransferase [Pyrinomonadaceae bacterium]|nr:SAM-dependent methyltransferase [Pyrinomonadaceae bacterium]